MPISGPMLEPTNPAPLHHGRCRVIFQNVQDRQDELVPPGGGREQHKKHIKHLPDVLDVVAVVSNPVRYRSRYDLFRAFEAHAQESGARLTIVEAAFANRPFEVTRPDNPRHVQVRTPYEYWMKENLVNLGIARLPRDARYVAWVDADLTFARHDWVQETLQQLQHYSIVQMFAEAHDLDPDGMILNSFRSFGWSHVHGVPRVRRGARAAGSTAGGAGPVPAPDVPCKDCGGRIDVRVTVKDADGTTRVCECHCGHDYYGGVGRPLDGGNPRIAYWHHPGFAWAARREAIDTLGGLFDVAVVGEADYIMAKALVGEASDVLYPGVSAGYRKAVMDWQVEAEKLRINFGYVPGTVLHGFHGSKSKRAYWSRCDILTQTQFDPSVDLKHDWQGLHQLVDDGTPRSILLRDTIRKYFRSREEDATSL